MSAWGHDFRPDYLTLGEAAERLGRPPVLALTATAAAPVREDIVEHLHMRDPRLVTTGTDRPAIQLTVHTYTDDPSPSERPSPAGPPPLPHPASSTPPPARTPRRTRSGSVRTEWTPRRITRG